MPVIYKGSKNSGIGNILAYAYKPLDTPGARLIRIFAYVAVAGIALNATAAYGRWVKGHEDYESAQRHIKNAQSMTAPESAIRAWDDAVESLEEINPGHPKYNAAQADLRAHKSAIAKIETQKRAARAEASKKDENYLAAYRVAIKQIDPDGLIVAKVARDENTRNQVVITVGPGWASANKTSKLDAATGLWQLWGKTCNCEAPRIKFLSQAGRNLGGTGLWASGVELKD